MLDLQRIWIANSDFNTAMAYLAAFGLTHYQVTTLVGKFGSQVVPILERDPYVLVREIPGFGFKRVDKIARKMGTPKDLPSRIRAGLQYCVLAALDDGDCWVEYEDLLDRANTLLVMDTMDSRDVIEGHLEALIAEGVLFCQPFERLVVADPEIHRMERELAEVLRTASAPNPHAVAELDGLLDAEGAELNPEQRDAVKNALSYSISLMTGGAGSGKTYAVSTITTIAERLELTVVLAAPTGKAAKRLEQVVGHEASTIHRLLGFNGRTYSRDALNPIDADILVVDEVSMVDVPLAWRLFQAIDRAKTAVVLVGDHNQLPPVGPGNLLRDLVKSRAIPTTVLTQIIRQAGVLKENSTAILSGEVRPTAEVKNGARRPWYVIDKFTDTGDVQRMLLLLFEEVLQERLGYDLVRDVQVLTPTHRGPLGTVELNIELQRLLQKKLFGFDVPDVEHGHRPRLYPGDKVIQMKNDYELGVMNGAMGIVLEVGCQGWANHRLRWPASRNWGRLRCCRQRAVGLRDLNPQSAGIGVSLRCRRCPQVAFLHASPQSAVHGGDARQGIRDPPRATGGAWRTAPASARWTAATRSCPSCCIQRLIRSPQPCGKDRRTNDRQCRGLLIICWLRKSGMSAGWGFRRGCLPAEKFW